MDKKIIVISIIMFLLGSASTALYLYLVGSDSLSNAPSTDKTQSAYQTNTMDQLFITQMIPHHEDAIIMAKMALDSSQHQEIKELANNINKTQSEEIVLMRTWYKAWFGSDVPEDSIVQPGERMGMGTMHMGMMGNNTDMNSLRNAPDFDQEFIKQMIPHHQMAIMMATMLLRSTDREEMKTLAQNIIDAQTKEIEEMRAWYATWYQ